ncbi:hypothetical protein [Desulfolutivibrio sulfoxidireducens]|uniref:hypothetical protein n=1 Tax=Desulfolutivibrio sulfoxidireducens TaxID=2773299 RepID=UPI00159E8ABB|nr:hypothetical protein [Desulfolutivibrio sulfoxidireducens]QLA18966.1 hypothetical protein GD604_04050 [Desulfolutivibrio sulfoxidireducens]
MNILIDFCNQAEWSPDTIGGIYRRYGIKHTAQGDADSVESFSASRHLPGICFNFANLERGKAILDEQVANLTEEAAKKCRKFWLFPGDEDFPRIFEALAKSQAEYRAFLDECTRGNLDLNFVNSRIAMLNNENQNYKVKFEPGATTWNPSLWLFPQSIRSIEEYIDAYGIIFPLYRGEGDMFSLTMKCKHCGNYFFAKTKRAEFCKDQCRKDHFKSKK